MPLRNPKALPNPTLDSSWAAASEAVLIALNSAPTGLTEAAVLEARRRYGLNTMTSRSHRSDAALLWAQVASPMMLMLASAAVVSLAVGSSTDAAIIVAIVVLSVLIGFSQERAAAHAVARLMARVAVNTVVVREGREREIPIADLVPGYIVRLRAGHLVPADAALLSSTALHVDEAALTGESLPTEKRAGPVPSDTPLAGRLGSLWFGTHVVSGIATAVIVKTGAETAFGAIAARLNTAPPPSDFQRGISAFGALLVKVTTALVFAIFAANMYFHRPFLESFLFAVALAVGLVPELLPAIVGVTLAAGARRMAKRGVIVKRLAVIENFGSMNVLCSDKTGTLTEGKVQLNGALDVSGAPSTPVLRYAAINAAFETGFSNPIDAALRAALPNPGGVSRLGEVPYDFIRRRLSVLVNDLDSASVGAVLVTKGALRDVLAVCTHARLPDGGSVPLSSLESSVLERFHAMSEQGLRVLGVATRSMPTATGVAAADEAGMTFEGFLAFADPPRPDAAALVAELRALEIRLQIITGDNAAVATRVARAVGIPSPVVVTGQALHALSEAASSRR